MPELPEVETIKSIIEPQIQGLTIEKVTVSRPEVIAYPVASAFCNSLTGQTISQMERRGKFLIIALHLRMTGCLLVTPSDFPKEKHTHIVMALSDKKERRFSDTRRFGRFWLLKNGKADTYSGIDKLGIEPLSPALTAEYLNAHLGKRKKAIKECLLDQSGVAGIGNIKIHAERGDWLPVTSFSFEIVP